MFSSLLLLFLKKPKRPFSSSSPKSLSSVTTSASIWPISPMSLVRTLFKALSEKSAIFFWLPAPYCMTAWVLVISIWAAKSSTIFCSWGVNTTSGTLVSSSLTGSRLFSAVSAGAKGSSVREGASFNISSRLLFMVFSSVCQFIVLLCLCGQKPESDPAAVKSIWFIRPSRASMVFNTCASVVASSTAS